MIANPEKFCLIQWRKKDLEFMQSLAHLMLDKTDPKVREEIEAVIRQFGEGCKALGDRIKKCPDEVDERADPEWTQKWLRQARWIKEDIEYEKNRLQSGRRETGVNPQEPAVGQKASG